MNDLPSEILPQAGFDWLYGGTGASLVLVPWQAWMWWWWA